MIPDQELFLSLYLALTITLSSTALAAAIRIKLHPEHYTHFFRSDQSRNHAVAGCLLTVLLVFPIVAKNLHPVIVLLLVSSYTFVIVPAMAGMYHGTIVDRLDLNLRFAIKSALDWLSAMPSLVWMVLLIQFQVVKLLPILYKHSLTFQFFFRQFLFCFLLEQLIFPTAWDVTILGMVMSLMLRRLSSKTFSSRIIQILGFCSIWGLVMALSALLGHQLCPQTSLILFSYTFALEVSMFSTAESIFLGDSYLTLSQPCGMSDQYDYWLHILVKSYSRVLLKAFVLPVDAFLTIRAVCHQNFILAILAMYANLFVPMTLFLKEDWPQIKSDICGLNVTEQLTQNFQYSCQDDDRQCPICLEDMIVARVTKTCGHKFHLACLHECLKTSDQCPMCRTTLLTIKSE